MLLETGTQWLGKIPEHWELSKIGHCFKHRNQTVSDKEFQPLSVTKNGVVPQLETAAKSDNSDGRKLIRKGDFVINQRSDRKGSAGISPFDGSCSVIYTVLEPLKYEPRYAHHLFRSLAFQEEFYRWGTGIVDDLWSTRYSLMRQIACPVPPLEEQKEIADFLDRELEQIDLLIYQQHRLTSLVKERVRGVIYAIANGGGSDIAAGSKPSDQWFQKAPKGWATKRVSELGSIINGYPFDSDSFSDNSEDMALVRIRDLQSDAFETFVPRETVPQVAVVKNNDVLIGMDGDFNVKFWDRGDAALNQRVCLIRCDDENTAKYLAFVLPFALRKINDLTYATTVKHLASSQVARTRIPMPPFSELEANCNRMLRQYDLAERLVRQAEALISISKERRQALINDAVTGKIDVRGKS